MVKLLYHIFLKNAIENEKLHGSGSSRLRQKHADFYKTTMIFVKFDELTFFSKYGIIMQEKWGTYENF